MLQKMKNSYAKGDFSVLIPDGESILALCVVRCLSQISGLRLNILSNDRWAPIRFSRHRTNFFYQMIEKDDEKRLGAICQAVKQTNTDVILPVDEPTIRLLSLHKSTLAQSAAIAPVPEPDVFEIAANKWLSAEFLKKNNIPCPPTILYQSEEGFNRISEFPFPVLLKPTVGYGGRGIEFFNNPPALLKFLGKHICSGKYIIQSFIRGYDIDCNVLCQEGKILAYTIQKGFIPGSRPFDAPAGIDFLYDKQVFDIVRQLVYTLKWSGVAHIDLRYDEQDNTAKIVEVNPRYWTSLLGSLIAGVNFPYLACLAALRADIPKTGYQFKRYVASKASIRIMTQNFLRGRRTDFGFDSTKIKFILKDPLPEMSEAFFWVYRKLFRNV